MKYFYDLLNYPELHDIAVKYEYCQKYQQSDPDIGDHILSFYRHRFTSQPFDKQEQYMAAVEDRKRKQIEYRK